MSSIVVGFDQHPAGRAALAFGARLAVQLGAPLHVVHVVDSSDLLVDSDGPEVESSSAGLMQSEIATLMEGSAAEWEFHSRHGNTALQIARIADEHDAEMIVLGGPKRGPMALVERLLKESVSAAAVRLSRRPVVLVPEHTKRKLSEEEAEQG